MMDRTGQKFGNYRLTRLLGQGGFAEIYLGEQVHLGTEAAIKVLHTQLSQEDQENFRREARTIAHLRHPNIVRVLDFGIENGTPFLVMDYAPNGTLRQRHTNGIPLSSQLILQYVKQIAGALQYVHDEGVIHRDIKPENMLLGSNDEVLLSDFGIAVTTQNQGPQQAIGTIDYMSPEQIKRQPVKASDQYSLAVVAYEWVSGNCPFEGASMNEIRMKHLQEAPPPLKAIVKTIPSAAEEVILKALAKNPQDRYARILDFADALEKAYQSLSMGQATAQPPIISAGSPLPIVVAPTLPISNLPPIARTPGSSVTNNSAYARTVYVPVTSILTQPQAGITLPPTKYVKRSQGSLLFAYRGHSNFVQALTWSPDGTRIASGNDDRTVHIWDSSTGSNLLIYREHTDQVWTVVWSPDGTRIASGSVDQVAHIWEAATGVKLVTYKGHSENVDDLGMTYRLSWSNDSQRLVSGSADHTVQVWNATTGSTYFTYNGHKSDVNAVSWSPDGKSICSASDDKTVQLFDAYTGNLLFTYHGHLKRIRAIAWSPDSGRIASGSDDSTVQIWNSSGDTSNILVLRGHVKRVNAVAWSPSGLYIASGSDDSTVRIWNATSGALLYTYRGHDSRISALAWSPDDSLIASASEEEKVQVWQAK